MPEFLNPYAPPTTETAKIANGSTHDNRKYQLATRGQRLMGSIIDGVVMLVVVVPVYLGLYLLIAEVFPNLLLDRETLPELVVEQIAMLTLSGIVFLAINGVLLAKRGQTVGKAALRMRIVSNDNQIKPLLHLFLMRYLLLWILVSLPFIGTLINFANALSIFRSNRKCLHDDWAGTKVISLSGFETVRKLPDTIQPPLPQRS